MTVPSVEQSVGMPAAPRAAPRRSAPALTAEVLVELAHDLRSPLTAIMSLADHLQHGGGGPVTKSQRRQLGIIYSAALCLSQTASGVVELGRGAELADYDCPGPFGLTELFASTVAVVAPMAEEKALELRTGVWVSDSRIGRVGALSRVLLNLTTNALKFTEEGFVELTATAAGHGAVELAVRDTGPGLDPGLLQSLFHRSTRVDAPLIRRRLDSTGLGLALCRQLVTSLGSELRVECLPDSGTRFVFCVELPEVEDRPTLHPASCPPRPA